MRTDPLVSSLLSVDGFWERVKLAGNKVRKASYRNSMQVRIVAVSAGVARSFHPDADNSGLAFL
jgi:hypothetical protein